MGPRSIALLVLLAALPASAHRDTKFPIAPNGSLQRFPDAYVPASLTLGPPDASGVPSTAVVRIGKSEVELPACLRRLMARPPVQSVEAKGSWYHDFELLPPYVAFEFVEQRDPHNLFVRGHTLMFDMRDASLIHVWRQTFSRVTGQDVELDLTQLCDASERGALAPRQ